VADKNCFVICPFGTEDSEERKRSDLLLEYVIKPAVESFDYTVDRADLSMQPGIVTVHVIQHLIEDALVVADITDRNPNVFYELAIRHAIRRPYVQLIATGQKIPFNIQEIQTVVYDLSDVERIKAAIERVKKQIIYYEGGGKVTSPVTVTIDELIGTRSLEQFSSLVAKLSELDSKILEAKEIGHRIEDMQEALDSIKSKIDSIKSTRASYSGTSSSSGGSYSSSTPDAGASATKSGESDKKPKVGSKEFTLSEYIDLDTRQFKK
jgi:hypothetical protein